MAPPAQLSHQPPVCGRERSASSDESTAPCYSRDESAAGSTACPCGGRLQPSGSASGAATYLSAASCLSTAAPGSASLCASAGLGSSNACFGGAAADDDGLLRENCHTAGDTCVVGLSSCAASALSVSIPEKVCLFEPSDGLSKPKTLCISSGKEGESLCRDHQQPLAAAPSAAQDEAARCRGGASNEAEVASELSRAAATTAPYRSSKPVYTPYNPYCLSRWVRQLLELTELPFMILWVYFAYFLVIVSLTAHRVKSRVWLSALVAGTLVGIGLNANAYRAIMYRGYPDVGIIVRFFLIPFGVSALSGLTHSLRDQFLLVFPTDPVELLVALTVPAMVVCSLMLSRIFLLYHKGVPIDLRSFFLNGTIYS